MTKKISIPIFHGWLYLYQGVPFDEVAVKHSMIIDKDGADAISGNNIDRRKVTIYIIAVTDKITASSIAHEALHVVNFMMKDRDMVPDLNNDEWQCYLLGWVVRQCHRNFNVEYK
jgi:hypothetical protein